LLVVLFRASRQIWSSARIKLRQPIIIIASGLLLFTINLGLAEIDRPQLLKRTFDRNYIVKYLGAYNFTIYDIIQNLKSSSDRVLADSNDITEVRDYIDNKFAVTNVVYFGVSDS